MRMEDDRIEALRKTILSPHGMRATVDEQLDRWHERDPENVASTGPLPRLGIGLPMSNIFATYVLLDRSFGRWMEVTNMLSVTLEDR